MIKIENITKTFKNTVLKDFSYEFPEKGLFIVKGESGAGKTTLLRIISGLEKFDSGNILIPENKKISFLFQDSRLLPHLSVKENISIVRKEKDEKKIAELIRYFGLSGSEEKHPDKLSGGMQRRVAIARSVYYGGDIYLWDEPTKELDMKNREAVIDCMKKISSESLMIAVTHDSALFGIGTDIEIKKCQ